MKVLVTGAAGFIGASAAEHLRAIGAQVFVDTKQRHPGTATGRPLTEGGLLQAMNGEMPNAILHAAGSGTVAKVAAQPALELAANLDATLAVLQYARTHAPHARVVFLSSAALYGNAPSKPQCEADARAPISLYGLAKAQAEQLLAFGAAQWGLNTTAVRLFSVYGPGLRKQLLWDAMNKFVAAPTNTPGTVQQPATFFGSGLERRDWIHIDDVCRFMAKLLDSPVTAPFEVYNCAGSAASTAEVLRLMAGITGAPTPIFNGQARAGDPQSLVAECSKAERELQWRATVHWREGVAQYARWYMDLGRDLPTSTP